MNKFEKWIKKEGDKWFDTIDSSITWKGFKRSRLLKYIEGKVLVDKNLLMNTISTLEHLNTKSYMRQNIIKPLVKLLKEALKDD